MLWKTNWWGIAFFPENDEDKKLLQLLLDALGGEGHDLDPRSEFNPDGRSQLIDSYEKAFIEWEENEPAYGPGDETRDERLALVFGR